MFSHRLLMALSVRNHAGKLSHSFSFLNMNYCRLLSIYSRNYDFCRFCGFYGFCGQPRYFLDFINILCEFFQQLIACHCLSVNDQLEGTKVEGIAENCQLRVLLQNKEIPFPPKKYSKPQKYKRILRHKTTMFKILFDIKLLNLKNYKELTYFIQV